LINLSWQLELRSRPKMEDFPGLCQFQFGFIRFFILALFLHPVSS
jgi:hypothetical protein